MLQNGGPHHGSIDQPRHPKDGVAGGGLRQRGREGRKTGPNHFRPYEKLTAPGGAPNEVTTGRGGELGGGGQSDGGSQMEDPDP